MKAGEWSDSLKQSKGLKTPASTSAFMFTSNEKGGVGGIPLVQVLRFHGGVTPYELFIQKRLTVVPTPRLKTGGGVLENWRTPRQKTGGI